MSSMATIEQRPEAARPPAVRTAGAGNERRLSAWLLVSLAGLMLALAAPFLAGRVYVADDLGAYHLPVRDFYARQVAAGGSWDWMPSLHAGFYLTGEGQAGTYHPLHWLLYRLLPLGTAFDLELLLSYPLLAAGMYRLAKLHTRRRDAALYAAMVFTFAGFNILHFLHPNAVAVVSHLPWLLVAIEASLIGGPRRRAWARLAVGLLTASQLLLGYPQYVWFSLLAEGAYLAWRAQAAPRPARAIAAVGFWKMLGLLAGAVQLLPTAEALSESTRSTFDPALVGTGSLHPLNLVQLVAPYLFSTRVVGQNTHELGLYLGAAPAVIGLWLMAHRSRWGHRRSAIVAACVLIFAGLVLAMGEHSGASYLLANVPLANRFRYPVRAIVLVHLALALLASLGLATLLEERRRPTSKRSSPNVLWAAVIASVLLAAIGPIVWSDFVASPLLVWTGPVLVGAAALLVHALDRGRRGAAVALVVLTAVDIGAYGLSYAVYPHTAELKQYVAAASQPPLGSPPTSGTVRIAMNAGVPGRNFGNQPLLAGYSRVDGYTGLVPSKALDYTRDDVLRLAGVSWVLEPAQHQPEAQARGEQPKPQAHARGTQHKPDAQARGTQHKPEAQAREPRSVAPLIRPSATFSRREKGAGTPDAKARGALVWRQIDDPLPRVRLVARGKRDRAGTASLTRDEPGAIDVSTDAATQQLLVINESYHRGWQATINGTPAAVLRVDSDFVGCSAGAGEHRMEFRFRPASLAAGKLLSCLGLSLMMCLTGANLLIIKLRSRS